MKFYLAFVVAVIGVGMVAADENLKSKLQMALKSMFNENEELQMQSRDTKRQCNLATNNCNNHGTCTEDRWGSYYCKCEMPYRVGGPGSSCYDHEELQMQSRDTKGQCNLATNNCNNHGTCTEDRWGSYYCKCEMPYRVGSPDSSCYGPIETREEVEMLARKYYSLSECSQGTNDCNENGECMEEDGKYWCECREGYEENEDAGCSPIETRAAEVDDDDFTERKKEILRLLAEFLQEE